MFIKSKLFPIIGFCLLSVMVLFLLGYTLVEAWFVHSIGGLIVLIILVGSLVAIIDEGITIKQSNSPIQISKKDLYAFLSLVVGALVTFVLSHNLGLGIVVAACMVGLFANLLFRDYETPIYCGAFVGMSSTGLFFSYFELLIAAVIAGVVYVIAGSVFKGYGGKLGTVAFIGTLAAGLGLSREFVLVPLPDTNTIIAILVASIIFTPLTYYLNVKKQNGPVMASAVIGLAGGLLLPVFWTANGEVLAVVVICASFIGMTLKSHCVSLWQMAVAGLILGIMVIYSTPLLGGAGGKLGTLAMISILSICGFRLIYNKIRSKKRI